MGNQIERRRERRWNQIWRGILRAAPTVSDLGGLIVVLGCAPPIVEYVEVVPSAQLEQLWSEIGDFLAGSADEREAG